MAEENRLENIKKEIARKQARRVARVKRAKDLKLQALKEEILKQVFNKADVKSPS